MPASLPAVPQTAEELNEAKRRLRNQAVLDVERAFLLDALRRSDYNVTAAASQTGMQRPNFQAMLRKHGLRLSDLRKAQTLDPNHVDVYRFLAEAALERGERAAARGNPGEREQAQRRAGDILAEGVEANRDRPEAYVNLLTQRFTVAREGGIRAVRDQVRALEPEYRVLAERFPSRTSSSKAIN